MTTTGTADFKHPKCYANTEGGCSTRISGEHFVSHSLIRLYTFDDPHVTIRHNNGFGVRHPVSPRRFVANVLCEAHNNGLSDADAAALKFATFLRDIALRYRNGSGAWGANESVEVSGDDFQRWVLKLLATHAAGNALTADDELVKSPILEDSIHLLLNRAVWPSTWGLCVAADATSPYLKFDPFTRLETVTDDWWGVTPMLKNGDQTLVGGVVDLAGVGFGLSLYNPGRGMPGFDLPANPLRGSIQRPSFMAWELNGVRKQVNFTWNDHHEHRNITYTMDRA
ncbi:hypothetical protein HQO42_13725 [Rhodococcus fascians]|nr:hypothetical protein [Rhodococcus fascians]MBY4239553.1 hypothetical protein [Rhodococcus fascians]MBY4253715.1 hypothetical protein [Rhodococcus fascians]MBY4271142.1 hypothetical protein [Rhodococcus fascians]